MITVNVDRNKVTNTVILSLHYGGKSVMFPLENDIGMINERNLSHLFNLCSEALRDLKNKKLNNYEENKDRIKFIGINYE